MGEVLNEKRKYRRAYFSLEESTSADVFHVRNDSKPVHVQLLSIGAGGISFYGNQFKLPGVKEGDRLILKDIRAPFPLGIIENIEVEVKYILDEVNSVCTAYGCQFINLPDEPNRRIEIFIDEQFRRNGMDGNLLE